MVAAVSPVQPKPAIDPAWTGVETYTARYEDTLLDLAVGRGLGFIEVAMANPGVDPWLPGAGTQVLLPNQHLLPDAPREGIVLNLPEQRLYLYEKGRLVRSYPIGIGRDGHSTPVGTTSVVRKAVDPAWRPTPSARADDPELPAMVPAGPDNPLGSRALYLGWTSYLIHGTNKEYGIGRRASRGCIRMYDDDVRELYQRVTVGTTVTVVDQPIKVGWIGNDLFLEASPTIQQVRQWEDEKRFDPVSAPEARELVSRKAGRAADRVDWAAVDRALAERRGIMTRITRPSEERPIATAASEPGSPAPSSGSSAIASAATASSATTAPPRRAAPSASGTPSPTIVLGNAGQPSGRTGAQSADTVQGAPSPSRGPARSASQAEPSGDELVKWLRSRLSSGSEP
jgi:L,D-transpeptidase ErfK/SrfK